MNDLLPLLVIVLLLNIVVRTAAGVAIGVSQYTESRDAIPFDDEQAKNAGVIEVALEEIRSRFSRPDAVAKHLYRQPLYWKFWQNESVKARVRAAQGYRDVDHVFSVNYHVKVVARASDGTPFNHHVVVNVEPRRRNPAIIGHWFCETGADISGGETPALRSRAVLSRRPAARVADLDLADQVLILSWNVWNFNSPWAQRVKRLANHIKQYQPAIIGFQEMRYDAVNSPPELGAPFQVRHLADLLPQYQYVYQPAMVYLNQGAHTDEGLAIFSQWPIVETSWTPLSRDRDDPEDDHQRILLRARVRTPRGAYVNFFVTHLSLSLTARRRTAVEMWHYMRQFDPPCVLVGDFNEEPHSELLNFLQGHISLQNERGDMRDSWVVLNGNDKEVAGWTFDTRNLRKRIDFVMVRGSDIEPQKLNLIGQMEEGPDRIASDHLEPVQNYFTTSWWLTMLVLGALFIGLDVLCCVIAWYS